MDEIQRGRLRAPAMVIDVDLTATYDNKEVEVSGFSTVWCLVRNNGVVADARFYDVEQDDTVDLTELCEQLSTSTTRASVVPPEGATDTLTVVIPTNRGANLPKVLNSLGEQSDSDFDILVVDNSADGHIADVVRAHEGHPIRYCHEPEPGLSRARNAALPLISSELVAWIDDDEEADRDWTAWIKRGFAHQSRPDAVVGSMVPAELDTDAQVNFERYGGFNKGRPMHPVELRAGSAAVHDPLYPLPSFGSGGNMAFRADVLRSIGGFDTVLGSPAIRGGEETRALSELLERGSTILHWPPALTWHYHRRTDTELEHQFFGYSTGLSGFYVSALLSEPRRIGRVIRLLPRGLAQMRHGPRNGESDATPIDFPAPLLQAARRGLLLGGWLYAKEAFRQWRSVGIR